MLDSTMEGVMPCVKDAAKATLDVHSNPLPAAISADAFILVYAYLTAYAVAILVTRLVGSARRAQLAPIITIGPVKVGILGRKNMSCKGA